MPFPVSECRIIETEQMLKRALPQALRQRLMRLNGGEVVVDHEVWFLHPVWDSSNRKTVGRSTSNILAETAAARSWHQFPPDGISLASNGGGDRLVICGSHDQVFRWDHETGALVRVGTDWL